MPGRGLGEAAQEVVAAAERRGYSVAATGPGTFRLARSHRPKWAIALAVIGLPFLGLGLLFLLIKETESAVISVYEDRDGTKARLVGAIDVEISAHLAQAPQREFRIAPASRASVSAPSGDPGSAAQPSGSSSSAITAPPLPPAPVERGAAPVPRVRAVRPVRAVRAAKPRIAAAPVAADDAPRSTDAGDVDIDRTTARPRSAGSSSDVRIVVSGGRSIAVGRGLVIGRQPVAPADLSGFELVAIAEPSLSKTHAAIAPGDGRVIVTDLHSTNGTVLISNGAEMVCPPGEVQVVEVGAKLWLGALEVDVRGAP